MFSRKKLKKEIVHIPDVKLCDASFQHVVVVGDFLFLSSQLSCNLKTGEIVPGSISEQTTRAMDNIKYLIESCGSKMDDIVKTSIFMRHTKDREAINAVYHSYFSAGKEPAKVSVQAASPIDGIDVEIDAIVIKRK